MCAAIIFFNIQFSNKCFFFQKNYIVNENRDNTHAEKPFIIEIFLILFIDRFAFIATYPRVKIYDITLSLNSVTIYTRPEKLKSLATGREKKEKTKRGKSRKRWRERGGLVSHRCMPCFHLPDDFMDTVGT